MRPPPQFAEVKPQDYPLWLYREIPHRVSASLTWLKMAEGWEMPSAPFLPRGDFHSWCINRSVEEGRKAALRWLIEFVGLKLDSANNVVPITPHANGKSVSIAQIGGVMMQVTANDAFRVAKAWQACSQSGMHPTTDTGHSDIGERDLEAALQCVIRHLSDHLYRLHELDLLKIVREQEKLHEKNIG